MTRKRILMTGRGLGLLVAVLVIAGSGATPTDAQPRAPADPVIAALMAQVETSTLIAYVDQLTGAAPALIGGEPYTFTTRETESGEPIAKATQFAYEFMAAHHLAVDYRAWSRCGIENRNVVAEKIGVELPDEIVLVTAHIDSTSDEAAAPGADDNASGSVGVMAVAEILAPVRVQRTLRFVLFTGEEQGLCGSGAYAREAADAGEEIVAVYNMDMIAWSTQPEPIVRLHTRLTNVLSASSGDLAIANTFVNVVYDYGLGDVLSPQITADAASQSDHYAFWMNGYPGILVIEDDDDYMDDLNPNYHTANDKVAVFNQAYYTNVVKASVGTVAELAGIVQTPAGPFKLYLPSVRH